MSFRYAHSFGLSATEVTEAIQGAVSTTYVPDSLIKMSAGLPVAVSGQTDLPYGVVVNVDSVPYSGQGQGPTGDPSPPLRPTTSQYITTTLGERLRIIPTTPGLLFEVDITPLVNAQVASSGTVSTVVVPYGGSTSDLNGGFVYIKDLKWQANIITSVVSAGNVTITFSPPAPIAVAAGMIVHATAYGIGSKVKFDSTNPNLTISSAVADLAAGSIIVRGVDLSKQINLVGCAYVMFQSPI